MEAVKDMRMMPTHGRFSDSHEWVMILFATAILLILFIPIPASLLDLLLISNVSWALMILLLTFYTDKPLSFSTFPSLLLISTLFRLALNISATRLILAQAHAGQVIHAIGQYVIHDNYVMGLVVFFILVIVQYVVITNGAQRVAEVAARFTLDSMPGKQMSIDADLNMGLVTQADAKTRRAQIEREAHFYGAMDGASKFVKGDAIAGVLIILVDIIGGFAIGIVQKGMSLAEAMHTYALLTIGDGLVTQIPALTISLATGIIVTRAATDAHLGNEVTRQITAYPKSLWVVASSLLGLVSISGMPFFPVFTIFGLFLFAAIYATRQKRHAQHQETEQPSLYEQIRILPIEIQFNETLFQDFKPLIEPFLQRVHLLREHLAYDLGLILPDVVLTIGKKLAPTVYAIHIQGNPLAQNQLHLDKQLAIMPESRPKERLPSPNGTTIHDPRYGLNTRWIEASEHDTALEFGYVVHDSLTVLLTHFSELIHLHLDALLTRNEMDTLLNQTGLAHARDELIPSLLSLAQVQRILQQLLQEKVSIRNLATILEVLLEHAKSTQDLGVLTELVRAKLAIPICQKLASPSNRLPVLTLAPPLEQKLHAGIKNNHFALDPKVTEYFITALATQVEQMLADRVRPVFALFIRVAPPN
jgi:flagellar biosynthesis protein FlhA